MGVSPHWPRQSELGAAPQLSKDQGSEIQDEANAQDVTSPKRDYPRRTLRHPIIIVFLYSFPSGARVSLPQQPQHDNVVH
jgi:hypothetical protein